MKHLRLNRILINAAIISVCMVTLPPPSGFIVGLLLAIGFNIYLRSKAQPAPENTFKSDIWQQNAQRLKTRRRLKDAEPTAAQRDIIASVFPYILGFAICLTLAAASYFQLDFIAFLFVFIAVFVFTLLYSFHKIGI